jgi:hypothetical protein
MESLLLADKSVIPDDSLVFSILGERSQYWKKLMLTVHDKYPGAREQWNYYNDGKRWLFRMMLKKKTLFWIGLLQNTFRITFYFGEKARPFIENSGLPEALKYEFREGKSFGRIRAVSILVSEESDIDNALLLTDIRIKV